MSPTAAPSSASVSEATPLLNPTTTSEEEVHDAIYSRFTPARKRAIVALLAAAGFVPCKSIPHILESSLTAFATSSFSHRIARAFHTEDSGRLGFHAFHRQVTPSYLLNRSCLIPETVRRSPCHSSVTPLVTSGGLSIAVSVRATHPELLFS